MKHLLKEREQNLFKSSVEILIFLHFKLKTELIKLVRYWKNENVKSLMIL